MRRIFTRRNFPISKRPQMKPISEKNTHGVKFARSNIGKKGLFCKISFFSGKNSTFVPQK
jgi:hypothetical protein